MAGKSSPLLLAEIPDPPGKPRQQFLYPDLYKNVRKDLVESIAVCFDSIQHDELSLRYRVSTQSSVYLNTFWLWMLEYTAGRDLDELARSFSSVVREFVIWNELNIPYRRFLSERFKNRGETDLTICAVDFDNRIEYQNALQLVSVGILLRDEVSVGQIVSAMDSNRHADALYEQLIVDYLKHPRDDMDEAIFAKPYGTLVSAYFQENPSASLDAVQSYLKNWYRYQAGARWYDAHKRIQEHCAFYYGYWAFEAGATAYLLDLDDSGINHRMYPKDLVAYAKRLRDANLVTSSLDVPIDETE
ncbi:PoNe immunity protein domain-containing protein [Cupriavidus nantongensis]|uniref:PoNe immunity protein domain-containing protein n=1 Tax=Cupriavidus nantongensis TaxID=1796606 RepID=UPI0022470DDA|nr:PoNe immunity protein domain-containing protein [Cupriavidus nantongensis]